LRGLASATRTGALRVLIEPGCVYDQVVLTKLAMVLVVFGVVAFAVGTLTVPELGEANPRNKIVAAISVAKEHRGALNKACEGKALKAGL